ncbi:peroxiredoxin [Desulfobaculum xiamenense]|uniref:Peroxiredoxin n=1 Tax=Desulfobaculum xiamenense TaxID=995050 RepID=A0A846QLQ5_9BACT|nr:TlpA disulfide reductase family protein [Desulfobaculum xiamenense]NJB66375.1 peroxiredoxin [Desulfobaculum xiamenense]
MLAHGCLCAMLVSCLFAVALAAELPVEGGSLGALRLPAPAIPAESAYLGVPSGESFAFSDLKADLVVIEVIGVYCPICHEQAPALRSLFRSLQRDGALNGRVCFLALASGATELEVAAVRKEHRAEYPILRDEDYSVHKNLGEPKTPFLILADASGKVLHTHLGRLESPEAFLKILHERLP